MTNDGVRRTGGGESIASRVVFISLRPRDKIRLMKLIRFSIVPLAVVLSIVTIGNSPIAAAAPACSLKIQMPANSRTFAKTNNQSDWQEYRSFESVPALRPGGGMSGQFWQHKHRTPSATMVEPGQDFQIETKYCFDEAGQLEAVGFEIRTALGWGYRAQGTATGGVFNVSSAQFFRLKDGKTTPQPDFVGGVPEALKPKLYLSVSELPFAGLLETTVASNRRLK